MPGVLESRRARRIRGPEVPMRPVVFAFAVAFVGGTLVVSCSSSSTSREDVASKNNGPHASSDAAANDAGDGAADIGRDE
jgi:hypothetical protein